jgi:hypothetical protein
MEKVLPIEHTRRILMIELKRTSRKMEIKENLLGHKKVSGKRRFQRGRLIRLAIRRSRVRAGSNEVGLEVGYYLRHASRTLPAYHFRNSGSNVTSIKIVGSSSERLLEHESYAGTYHDQTMAPLVVFSPPNKIRVYPFAKIVHVC